ncbi:MAG: metalloregulator ArsR/SmtB family transcription factor [Bryobacteraceae bacterium]|nr:metalloregulator ArsR/SmtB family transcription factor [Bryobacteraceae bacterium]MDW8376631.1 metalloregulator ArsR/SmtB family transcription factor [Bryobacterales bacterium]
MKCSSEHSIFLQLEHSPEQLERAARLFRAIGDPARLRLLAYLAVREACVSELASAFGEQISTVSQRLRLLRAEKLVVRRRWGKHVNYGLADRHVAELVGNALEHVNESGRSEGFQYQERFPNELPNS